jgi:hypothetical protein
MLVPHFITLKLKGTDKQCETLIHFTYKWSKVVFLIGAGFHLNKGMVHLL